MVIVIGATGFIGLYTVEKLIESGKEVIATGRNRKVQPMLEKMGAEFIELDITNKKDFDKLPIEGVDSSCRAASGKCEGGSYRGRECR